jgi:hypothetical protein
MGIRGNFPRAGTRGLSATFNVSSPEVKNKCSYTSTPPTDPHFMDRDSFTIIACFVVKCVRSLIPIDYGVLLNFYDFVQPSSKSPASKLIQCNPHFTFQTGPIKMNVKSSKM